jgi:putative transposase
MKTNLSASDYKGYRFPPVIISHCVWLYFRFSLSFRDVEELMAERGIVLTYETVRQWCQKFGSSASSVLRGLEMRLPQSDVPSSGRLSSLYGSVYRCRARFMRESQKFGQTYANDMRRWRPYCGDKWHLDEVVLTICGGRWISMATCLISWCRADATNRRRRNSFGNSSKDLNTSLA